MWKVERGYTIHGDHARYGRRGEEDNKEVGLEETYC